MKQITLFLFLVLSLFGQAQKPARPKLIVGMVVDQMRWDYLYRYSNRYTPDGFKRMLREGFSCENTFIPYMPTYTAPGHTCVYTGSVPSLHGIVGNDWYSKELKRTVYCTEDTIVQPLGSSSAAGRQSPANLWTTTITDELRLSTNFRSKTIGIALKDRGSILPAGHTANAAYWFDNATGGWISSTWYQQALPEWVQQFNQRKLPEQYLKKNWTTLFPINTYQQSTEDNKPYENNLPGEDNTFAHNTAALTGNAIDAFRHTPYANTYTFEMAKAAIANEKLGQGSETDFLAVSFSATDAIGHTFGPNSVEVEDMYLRFDRDLADFLKYLDATLGKKNYLLFMTADHGVAHVPAFAQENKIAAGTTSDLRINQFLKDTLQKVFNRPDLIASVMNYQVYLNDHALRAAQLDKKLVKQTVIRTLMQHKAVSKAVDLEDMTTFVLPEKIKTMLVNGYNQKLSGEIQFLLKPQWFDGGNKGSTHGAWNPYDAHIPLVWFGWNISPGQLNREVYMTDIAPTLAALLHIQMPNGNIGNVIPEVGAFR